MPIRRSNNNKSRPDKRRFSNSRRGFDGGAGSALPIQAEVKLESDDSLVACGKKKTYPIRYNRNLPVIPGDVITIRIDRNFDKQWVALPATLIRGGSCRLTGLYCPGEKEMNERVVFSRWQLPSLTPPTGAECEKIKVEHLVEVTVERDRDQQLTITRLKLGPHRLAGQPIYDWTIFRFGLRPTFPDTVVRAAEKFDDGAQDQLVDARPRREDLTHLAFATIDGEDARDYDDAVYCRAVREGFQLFVAIADVSSYVAIDDEIDNEARLRATSVYFPGKVLPMLPDILSNDRCSLVPDRLRLVMVCRMNLDPQGRLLDHRFSEAVIRSRARLTYDQVNRWRDQPEKVELIESREEIKRSLNAIFGLYRKLGQRPQQKLNIELPEYQFKLDNDHHPTRMHRKCRGDAEKMIEEMMILANVSSALTIDRHRDHPGIYRVHPRPEFESVNEVREIMQRRFPQAKWGPPPEIIHQSIRLLATQPEPEREFWYLYLIRNLAVAEYTSERQLHFGLGIKHYAHFTSPIRRYPDLVNHRIIKRIIHGDQPAYQVKPLEDNLKQLNAMIRSNDKAMMSYAKELKMRLCRQSFNQVLDAYIEKMNKYGAFVYIPKLAVSAFMSKVPNYRYDFAGGYWYKKSDRRRHILSIGDRVRVKLTRLDIPLLRLDVDYVDH